MYKKEGIFGEALADSRRKRPEETVNRRTAARHGGIEGTLPVQLLFNFTYLREHPEDRALEIIDQQTLPSLRGLLHDLSHGNLRLPGHDGLVGFPCMDMHRRFHQYQMKTSEIHLCGGKDIACSGGKRGCVPDEKRTIGSQFSGLSLQLGFAERQ